MSSDVQAKHQGPLTKPEKKPRTSFYKGTHNCCVCGVEFRSQNLTPKYCSSLCMAQGRRKVSIRTCINCGKSFEFKPSQLKAYANAGKYCSRECGYAYKRKHSNPHILAGKNWQKAVRKRDNSICQRCGIYDPYIHTHHIATRRRRPDLKFDVSNGICLCGSCHAWVHHHPLEAAKIGLLVDGDYELAHLTEQKANAARGVALVKKKGEVRTCTACGKRRYYPASALGKISKSAYRCIHCYQSVSYSRGDDMKFKIVE